MVIGEETGVREVVEGCMWVDERESTEVGGALGGEGEEGSMRGERQRVRGSGRGGGGSESEGEGERSRVGDDVGEGKQGRKIAWRYEGMGKFKTTVGTSLLPRTKLSLHWIQEV